MRRFTGARARDAPRSFLEAGERGVARAVMLLPEVRRPRWTFNWATRGLRILWDFGGGFTVFPSEMLARDAVMRSIFLKYFCFGIGETSAKNVLNALTISCICWIRGHSNNLRVVHLTNFVLENYFQSSIEIRDPHPGNSPY